MFTVKLMRGNIRLADGPTLDTFESQAEAIAAARAERQNFGFSGADSIEVHTSGGEPVFVLTPR